MVHAAMAMFHGTCHDDMAASGRAAAASAVLSFARYASAQTNMARQLAPKLERHFYLIPL